MSAQHDPLIAEYSRDRVAYATGVLLDAADFTDEQNYHRARLARALALLHGSGTIAGLRVDYLPEAEGQTEQIVVNPGLAIDRRGRLVEVPHRACIRLAPWYNAQDPDQLVQALHPRVPPLADDPYNGVVVDVFLRFLVCERGKTPAFAAGAFEALDAVAPARLRDGYELRLMLRPEDRPPLPQNHWPDIAAIADPAAQHTAVQDAIFNAWPEFQPEPDHNPEPLLEYMAGQDQSAVFLARIEIPATASAAGPRPERAGALQPQHLHNDFRLFVYRTRLIAKGDGL